jgi:ketosteroid isomerase-like protein
VSTAESEFASAVRSSFEEGIRAWNEGDLERAYRTLGDECEYSLAPIWPEARPLRGRDEVVKFFAAVQEMFPDIRSGPIEFVEIGERRVILGFPVVATGRGSGVPIEGEIWQVWELAEGGRPVRVSEYLDRAAALRAAEVAG